MTTRRTRLAYGAGTSLILHTYDALGAKRALAQVVGGTLDPAGMPKYAAPMRVPPVMPRAGTAVRTGGKNVDASGRWAERLWADPVRENPAAGSVELWEVFNATADAHPVHFHEVTFQVADRQSISVAELGMTVALEPGSRPPPPEPWVGSARCSLASHCRRQ